MEVLLKMSSLYLSLELNLKTLLLFATKAYKFIIMKNILYFHARVNEKNIFSKDTNLFLNILSYGISAHFMKS